MTVRAATAWISGYNPPVFNHAAASGLEAPCAPKAPAPTARAADKAANIAIIERSLRIFHRQCACCALRGRLNLLLRPDFLRHPERPGVACHRSEEHTSELQSLMRISYAVFCLKKKKKNTRQSTT